MQRNEVFAYKIRFSNPYIFATQCRRLKIFQRMDSVRSNHLCLGYIRFTPRDCKDRVGLENLSLWQILNSVGANLR